MNKDKKIHQKINDAVKILCEIYDILNESEENYGNESSFYHEKKLLTIEQFCKKHRFVSTGSIRHLISKNENNFKEEVLIKIGKRILINEDIFFKWAEKHNKFTT